jgi:predicted SAM-dependent methyltransferase
MTNLNLGSFYDVVEHPDWLNIDILPLSLSLPKTVRFLQADLAGGLPMCGDGTVDLIRMSHLIEHITLDQAKRLLKDCHRVLKPGGVLRIATPDAEIILKHYMAGDMAYFDSIQPPEYVNAPTPGEKLSRLLFSGDYAHRALYDYSMLESFLEQAGKWACIYDQPPGVSVNQEMLRLPDQHCPVSLYVEAVR